MKKLALLVFFSLLTLPLLAEEDVHKTLDEKLAILKFGTSYEKITAIEYLGTLSDKEVFDKRNIQAVVEKILKDSQEDPRVRYAASSAIEKLLKGRLITRFSIGESLFSILKDEKENDHVRSGVLKTLGILMKLFPSEPKVSIYTTYMRELLKLPSGKNALKIEAIRTICQLGDTAAEDALNFALSDPFLVDTAVTCLADLLASGADLYNIVIANKLLAVFTNIDISAETRVKAGDSLCFLVRNGLKLASRLDDVSAIVSNPESDADVIVTACKILYTVNNKKSLRPITTRLEDDELDEKTRVRMIQILGDFFRQISATDDSRRTVNNALTIFAKFINTTDLKTGEYVYSADIRRVAVFALGQVQKGFNQGGAVLILFGALSDKNETVSDMAYESLRAITGQDFGKDEKAWQKWFDKGNFR